MNKTCFKCRVAKPLSEFYRHPYMADGHLNKCKECTKRDVQKSYQDNHAKRRAYDRRRARDPVRRAAKVEYKRRIKQRHPVKAKAWRTTTNAIRDGKLIRQPCELCGSRKAEAHHDDYSKPLDVRWLCFACHRTSKHGQRVDREGNGGS